MAEIKIKDWETAGKYIEDLKIDINYFDFGPPGNPKYSWMAKTFKLDGVVITVSEINNDPLVAIENLIKKLNNG